MKPYEVRDFIVLQIIQHGIPWKLITCVVLLLHFFLMQAIFIPNRLNPRYTNIWDTKLHGKFIQPQEYREWDRIELTTLRSILQFTQIKS